MVRLLRRVTGVVLTGAAVMLAPAVASADPTGTVSGWRSPVAGAMTLAVSAVPDGAALSSASVTLGGVPVGSAPFANGDCSDGCPATAVVDVDTTSVPDGSRELVVTVVDALGESHELDLPDAPLMLSVDNAPRVFTPSVTIEIGSGTITQNPSPPGSGPGTPVPHPGCRAPKLSMQLDGRPLGYRRGVPVLERGKTYRYKGTLTCRIDGRRRPAPRGMEVQVRNLLRGATLVKPPVDVRKAGEIVARLAYGSSRTIVFRVRGAGGELVRVRIPIRVVRR